MIEVSSNVELRIINNNDTIRSYERIIKNRGNGEGTHMSLVVSQNVLGGILIAADGRSMGRINGEYIPISDAYEKIVHTEKFVVAGVGCNMFAGRNLTEFVRNICDKKKPENGLCLMKELVKSAKICGADALFCVVDVRTGEEYISGETTTAIKYHRKETTPWLEYSGEGTAGAMAKAMLVTPYDTEEAVSVYVSVYDRIYEALTLLHGTSPVGPLYSMYFIKDGKVRELVKEGKICH